MNETPTCFTSIVFNYLPKARALAASVKQLHPDWRFVVCICDRPTNDLVFDLKDEPFDEVIWAEELEIENIYSWIFRHTLVEMCTAVKGQVAWELLTNGCEKVIYFDPDIIVFNDISVLDRLLDHNDIILTPHQLEPEETIEAIQDNEICSLRHGVFNLGFFAISSNGDGLRFTEWWRDRLINFCYADFERGLFTDQKWCDLAPAFFSGLHILRDPACDVASWNISRRRVTCNEEGQFLVNGNPLLFYHFSSVDSGAAEVMSDKYASDNLEVFELIRWYQHELNAHGQKELGGLRWYFDCYENGEKISFDARRVYRDRPDLQETFENPFSTGGMKSYYRWFRDNGQMQDR